MSAVTAAIRFIGHLEFHFALISALSGPIMRGGIVLSWHCPFTPSQMVLELTLLINSLIWPARPIWKYKYKEKYRECKLKNDDQSHGWLVALHNSDVPTCHLGALHLTTCSDQIINIISFITTVITIIAINMIISNIIISIISFIIIILTTCSNQIISSSLPAKLKWSSHLLSTSPTNYPNQIRLLKENREPTPYNILLVLAVLNTI